MNKAFLSKKYGIKSFQLEYFLLFLVALFSAPVSAEVSCNSGITCTQTIKLKPGWNAIYLQVKPDANRTNEVFADLLDGSGAQISSVWTWLSQRAQIEFIQDPNTEDLLSSPGWLYYFPEANKRSLLTNLFSMSGNRSYLVKLEGTSEADLVISGTPSLPRLKWSSSSFNLTGFHVDPDNRPTFHDYFAASPAHTDQPVYQLIDDGWQQVDRLTTLIEPDVAYWVFVKGGSDYAGPVDITMPQIDGIDFGGVNDTSTLRIKNELDGAQNINLQLLGGASGLNYPNPDLTAAQRWLPLPASYDLEMASGGEERLELGLRRADFSPGSFGHILQVTSASGMRWLVPVKAEAPALNSLWVGTVTINQVSQAQNYQHDCYAYTLQVGDAGYVVGVETKVLLKPGEANYSTGYELCADANGFPISDAGDVMGDVASEFSFRIILHREGTQVRLLKSVIQMWKAPTDTEEGHYVLITDDSIIPNFTGIALRDGEMVGKRISSTAYDFPGDTLDMTGSMDDAAVLTAMLNLASNTPTNPFKHQYHPDHNNLSNNYETPVIEAYAISRLMELTFDSASSGELGGGYNVKQGNYREVVTGLHKVPIVASGTFVLKHAASINTLNQ
ncbi:MAG: hypothetical protein KAU21_14805 [Gammaproteobacteria bacterium]|nr:hypothetical protein [Gammaproteobacteria bacterium]